MIHLFKKVYIASDKMIDLEMDRVIISEEYGIQLGIAYSQLHSGDLIHAFKNTAELVGQNMTFATWTRFFDFLYTRCTETGKRIIIYADDTAFLTIATAWFKLSLPYATSDDIRDLIESLVFRHNVFYRSRWSTNQGRGDEYYSIDPTAFLDTFDSIEVPYNALFANKIKPYMGVEFLLATYLYSGQMKSELKDVLKILIRKDTEKFLYEVKEIFLVHFVTERFASKLNLDKTYNMSNLNDIVLDQSKFARLFFDPLLWSYPFMTFPSSDQHNVLIENFTEQNILDMKEFIMLATQTWPEEGIYVGPKSDVSKLDFLGIYTDFTDVLLDQIIDVESTFEHAAGSFFSIDLETVNNYLMEEILSVANSDNKEPLKPYTLA